MLLQFKNLNRMWSH